jgi:saccharopine dehydrogenase-like NADP-dependent oxidoreductase
MSGMLHQEHDSRSGLSSMASATGAMCVAVAEAILGGVWRRPGVSPGEIIGRDARAFEAIMGSLDQWHLKLRHESVALD